MGKSRLTLTSEAVACELSWASRSQENAMTESATPKIVSRDEWEQARAELLVREKAPTPAGDDLPAARGPLPMTRMEPVMVVGRSGPVPLADVFEGRRMLIVYHFMWKNGAPHHKQCEGCTHSQVAMNAAVCAYLAERDVNYVVFSSGPWNEIIAYRDFMGWTTPWYSTVDSGDVLRTRDGGDLRCYLRSDPEFLPSPHRGRVAGGEGAAFPPSPPVLRGRGAG